MTQIDEQAGTPAGAGQIEGLEVRIARQLLEQARVGGVSLVGPGGLLAGVTKTVLQAALDAEIADHLGYEKGERPPFPAAITADGTSPKTVLTEVGLIPLEVPRDRNGKFEPQIVPETPELGVGRASPTTDGRGRQFGSLVALLAAAGVTAVLRAWSTVCGSQRLATSGSARRLAAVPRLLLTCGVSWHQSVRSSRPVYRQTTPAGPAVE
jgi:hypothetical protein